MSQLIDKILFCVVLIFHCQTWKFLLLREMRTSCGRQERSYMENYRWIIVGAVIALLVIICVCVRYYLHNRASQMAEVVRELHRWQRDGRYVVVCRNTGAGVSDLEIALIGLLAELAMDVEQLSREEAKIAWECNRCPRSSGYAIFCTEVSSPKANTRFEFRVVNTKGTILTAGDEPFSINFRWTALNIVLSIGDKLKRRGDYNILKAFGI